MQWSSKKMHIYTRGMLEVRASLLQNGIKCLCCDTSYLWVIMICFGGGCSALVKQQKAVVLGNAQTWNKENVSASEASQFKYDIQRCPRDHDVTMV